MEVNGAASRQRSQIEIMSSGAKGSTRQHSVLTWLMLPSKGVGKVALRISASHKRPKQSNTYRSH